MKPFKSFLILACLMVLLAACAPMATSETVLQQTEEYEPLRFVTSFTIKSLDPVSQGFWLAEYGVAELLMQYRDDGNHYPWLLNSIENVDDLTWVLTLREGLTFQNGKPVDEEAVLAVINRQMELSSSAQSSIPEGTVFEITAPLEITVKTLEPYPRLIPTLASESVFPIYDVEAVEAVGENFGELAGTGFYTGPFSVVSLDDQALILERNENYWAGRPKLQGVEVRFVSDAQARILAVQNGEADICNYPPTEAKSVVDATDGVNFVYGWPSSGGFRAILNTQESPFDDPAVRKAFNRAIDYAVLANDVMDGVVKQATGFFPEWVPFSIQNQVTDLEQAKQLLDEAGWVVGDDGIREKDGERLSIIMLIYPQQPDLVPISEAIQAQVLEAGIEVEIQLVDSIFDALTDESTVWDVGVTSGGSLSFGGSPEQSLLTYDHSEAYRNWAGHTNPELDALIDELAVTFDSEKRTEILKEFQRVRVEEDPQQFFLTFHTTRFIVNDNYQDYHPGMALYFVHYLTTPGEYETPTFEDN